MTVEIKGKGKITANKELLNYISLLANEASLSFIEKQYEGLAKEAQETSEQIYEALINSFLYENL